MLRQVDLGHVDKSITVDNCKSVLTVYVNDGDIRVRGSYNVLIVKSNRGFLQVDGSHNIVQIYDHGAYAIFKCSDQTNRLVMSSDEMLKQLVELQIKAIKMAQGVNLNSNDRPGSNISVEIAKRKIRPSAKLKLRENKPKRLEIPRASSSFVPELPEISTKLRSSSLRHTINSNKIITTNIIYSTSDNINHTPHHTTTGHTPR